MIDVAVIGAGPAGCAAAIMLARAGRDVVLLERQAAARESVCGEFLGADAATALAVLGLDPGGLGGVPLRRAQVGVRQGLGLACRCGVAQLRWPP